VSPARHAHVENRERRWNNRNAWHIPAQALTSDGIIGHGFHIIRGKDMIDAYLYGSMQVLGVRHEADLKIIQDRVVANWWRRQGHVVDTTDVADILAAGPEILVVGMGQPGQMRVAESLRTVLKDANIALVEEPTAGAIQTFNRFHAQGRRVAGAFHLTC
jgi:hypothetical protein